MPSDLRHLAELQAKATKAPWFHDTCEVCNGVSQGTGPSDRVRFITDETTWNDGAFITACGNTDFAALAERLEFMEESLRDAVRLINHLGGNPANQKKALALCAALTEETEADHD